MKQVWITAKGAPESLQLRESPDPQAGAGKLRIRVAYAGINFADIQARWFSATLGRCASTGTRDG